VSAVRGRLGDGTQERVADPLGFGPPARPPRRAIEAIVSAECVVHRLGIDVAAVDEDGGRPEDPVLRRRLVVDDVDDLNLGGNADLVDDTLDDDDRHVAIRTVLAGEDLDPHPVRLLRHVSAPPPR
jgi:hypothetical protein